VSLGDDATSRPFDVVIAGAGLAGASLACWVARSGARVALVDPGRFPRDKLCGEFLSPECWVVLTRMGLDGGVERAGYHAIRRVRVSTPSGRVIDAEFAGPDERPGIGLSRTELDHQIVEQARAEGVLTFEGVRVGRLLVEEGRVVGFEGSRPGESPLTFRATVTVAANGRHSALVRASGTTRVRRPGLRPPLVGMKRHLSVSGTEAIEPDGTVGLHLIPGGYGGTCRVESSLTNLCALLPEAEIKRHRGDLDRVATAVLGQNPRLAKLWEASEPQGEWKTVAGVRVEISTPNLPGILYAGDCQGTVDPLGGQGMTMALLGAELLAPHVLASIQANGVSSFAQRQALAAWRDRFDRRIQLCRMFHHLLVRPGWVDLAARTGSLAPWILATGFGLTRDPRSRSAIPALS
jgi:flavin-dependent dehydrogenase